MKVAVESPCHLQFGREYICRAREETTGSNHQAHLWFRPPPVQTGNGQSDSILVPLPSLRRFAAEPGMIAGSIRADAKKVLTKVESQHRLRPRL